MPSSVPFSDHKLLEPPHPDPPPQGGRETNAGPPPQGRETNGGPPPRGRGTNGAPRPQDNSRRLRRRVLSWFDRHQRDLPWRRDRDPYRIWVSEAMLQQTQVATVLRYYERFLEAFPTLGDLARADEQKVLRIWQGLGYYRRARDLHAAARRLVREHQGEIRDDPAVFGDLPGVGRYMLGAVLSQAYDRRLPIVDANIERVLCRFFGHSEDPRRGAGRRWLWGTAQALLPTRRVGDFNQALMELGALICTSANPKCARCPLADWCVARRQGLHEKLPALAAPPRTVHVQEVAVVLRRGTRVYLVQRPDKGRWAGMWEFPRSALLPAEPHEVAAIRILRDLVGIEADLADELITVRHTVTKHRITLVCFEARCRKGKFRSAYYRQGRWIGLDEISEFPSATPQRRIVRALTEARQGRLFR
jgi:A/G-specific adenine glycosylase